MAAISAAVAWRLRSERGLALPTNKLYENPEVALIAEREDELLRELATLDERLHQLSILDHLK